VSAIHQLCQALPRGMGVDPLSGSVHGAWCGVCRVSMGGTMFWGMWSHPWRAMADDVVASARR
jgi:hypothetical protein